MGLFSPRRQTVYGNDLFVTPLPIRYCRRLQQGKNEERLAVFTTSLSGAGNQIRTDDLVITNDVLYQLSYTSISATEWILADTASFVKPEFFIFREEWLLHFKICSPAEKRRPYGRPCGRCSLCGCELLRGERGWYLNGQSVCADCFPAFARAELAPCETVFGMEGEA